MPRLSTSLVALLGCSGAAGLAAPSLAGRSAVRSAPPLRVTLPPLMAEERWPEVEAAAKVPFEMEPYKGRVKYGFSNAAERINGRVAMMAFVILYLQEAVVGKGVLTQYGLPYDAGAIVEPGNSFIPGPVGLVIAVAISAGVFYGGIKLDNKLSGVDGVRGYQGENKGY